MPQQIETPRLILRAPHEDDAETLVRELNNYNISRNTGRIPFPYGLEDAVKFLQHSGKMNPPSNTWAITAKPDVASLMGVISLEYDPENDDAELGYWLAQSVWGKGFATEAALAVVAFAFTDLQLKTLVACFHNDNPVSGRILKGLGFVETGACTSFSRAQNAEVAVTNLRLGHAGWVTKKGRNA